MTAKSAPRPPARRPASPVQTTLRALVDEARPSGRLTLTLFGPHEPGAVIAEARAVVALACCDACTMEGPAVLRKKLMNFLGTIFPGLRAGAPTHGAPASLQ